MTAPLPTPGEVEGMRERHVAIPGSDIGGPLLCERCMFAWPCDASRLLALVDSLHSWRGLMALMDEHWPADIFTMGDEPPTGPGDPGPRILALARWVDALQARLAAALALCDEITDAAAYGHKVGHPANHGQRAHDIDRIRRAATGEAT